ncbi:sigma-70 family RNA polymerase sigma factor [Nocardioides sp. HDW12B]|uniref:sigma-70 family RNA polymerase sigma factor n=1 Tax=Nocardioides sp. HDW12B TaxID=2714939 RepID=UPI00140BBD3A|nr:sigma-70 family RNA polymerase sigma factor [Nocardioides sp. HDW12B]QIK65126.1 sigma-70 family RNA polymerase sigma factor [Nocardioides sp. HDW12B]
MHLRGSGHQPGLDALRRAVAEVLLSSLDVSAIVPTPALATPTTGSVRGRAPRRWHDRLLASDALVQSHRASPDGPAEPSGSGARAEGEGPPGPRDETDLKVSSLEDEAEGERLIALVDLAKAGDADAFGLLYDHYQPSVYRFLYYRLGSVVVAEDLTSETFFRALRSMPSFTWQGKDFGAWLMTIARNLTMDHFKSSKTRLEMTTEDMSPHDSTTESPEAAVLAHLTNEALMAALKELPAEQQECLIMRFLQGLSIAETAAALGRSDGAVKQLQLRGVRNLAKLMPEGLR